MRAKNVGGVTSILLQIREDTTEGLISKGQDEEGEEGEEKVLTHAEETLREIRREERKKQKEELFKKAKESCK